MTASGVSLGVVIAGGLLALSISPPAPVIKPRVAVATSDVVRGSCEAIRIGPPWKIFQGLESIDHDSRLRYFLDEIYVIERSLDQIRVIDPTSFDTLRTLPFGENTSPEDILVVSPDRAFVTLYDSSSLAIVDPRNGASLGSIDLTPFADEDGLPEMSMMACDGNLLFVQIQRIDRGGTGELVPPSYLALVDLDTEALFDADPNRPGIQGIELLGTRPSFRMHVDSRARRLFVSTPGDRLSVTGGIEEIDLRHLRSLGFLLSEAVVVADLGGFVMTSSDEGYVSVHTEFITSSHLHSFSRDGGEGPELLTTFGMIDTLALDPVTQQLYFPDPFSSPFGVYVLDAATGTVLTETPLVTGLPPRDLTVVRRVTPGEVRDLRVAGRDELTEELSLTYRPACGASDHNIVYGALEEVGTYSYSGQVCGIGSSGSVEGFDPGSGSFFFLVVGTGAVGDEGSYGADSQGDERPEDLIDPSCAFDQNLSFPCDR